MTKRSINKERNTLFNCFLIVFLSTCLVTLVFVSVYLYQTIIKQQEIELPEVLKGLIAATLIEVAAGIIAYYKKIFGVNWQTSSQKTNENNAVKAIFEVDPYDPEIWGKDGNFSFKWYNAPYGLAVKELGEMNMHKIVNQHVDYQLLLIEGNDKEGKIEYNDRFIRMNEFVNYLNSKNIPIKGNIEIRVQKNTRTPSISFYILKKNERRTAIFYLQPLIKKDGKALKAFQTQNESVVDFLDKDFGDCWDVAKPIDLSTLLESSSK